MCWYGRGAPAHRAHSLQVPERLSLISLPADTPELNPSARVWPLVKEGVANRAHESLDEREQKVCLRCQKIGGAEVSARTSYHRWPQAMSHLFFSLQLGISYTEQTVASTLSLHLYVYEVCESAVGIRLGKSRTYSLHFGCGRETGRVSLLFSTSIFFNY